MTCEKLLRGTLGLKSIQIGGLFQIARSSIFPIELFAFASCLRCYRFSFVAIKNSPPSAPASSSDSSSPRESLDLQSRLRATEAFIQANPPSGSTPVSSRVAPLLPVNLGKSDMILPVMRTSSTERFMVDDAISATDSIKSFVERLDILGGVDNTFADLDTADFASRAAGGDFTENTMGFDTIPPSSNNNNTIGVERISFDRISLAPSAPNSTLAGTTLAGTTLAGSSDDYNNNTRLRERSVFNVSEKIRTPLPKQEQCGGFKKRVSETLVRVFKVETGDVGYNVCGEKIRQGGGANQVCIATVVTCSNTCGVRFYSVKAEDFEDGRLYVTTFSVRGG